MGGGAVHGMEAVVTALGTTISPEALWGSLVKVVPLIGTVALFSLGFLLVRRLVKGIANKGKTHV